MGRFKTWFLGVDDGEQPPDQPKRGNLWTRLPTWAKWAVGAVGLLVVIGLANAAGSSQVDDLEADVAQATQERDDAKAAADEANATADAVVGRREEIIETARTRAGKIIRRARSKRSQQAETGADEEAGSASSEGPEEPWQALQALEEQASAAAAELTGITDSDLLPSEGGAKLLVDNGYIDSEEFCATDATLTESELGVEAEAAFETGWTSQAPPPIADMGATMYNALWTVYCLPE